MKVIANNIVPFMCLKSHSSWSVSSSLSLMGRIGTCPASRRSNPRFLQIAVPCYDCRQHLHPPMLARPPHITILILTAAQPLLCSYKCCRQAHRVYDVSNLACECVNLRMFPVWSPGSPGTREASCLARGDVRQ